MLGHPKYTYEDKVRFQILIDDEMREFEGKVYIIDEWGTFQDNSDVSYDIIVEDFNGAPCLFKHIPEFMVNR